MDQGYLSLIELGISLFEQLIAHFTKSHVPQEVLDALTAAYNALQAHRNDVITKAALEAQRG